MRINIGIGLTVCIINMPVGPKWKTMKTNKTQLNLIEYLFFNVYQHIDANSNSTQILYVAAAVVVVFSFLSFGWHLLLCTKSNDTPILTILSICGQIMGNYRLCARARGIAKRNITITLYLFAARLLVEHTTHEKFGLKKLCSSEELMNPNYINNAMNRIIIQLAP